ncbi:hypothetical protein HMN09_01241900 [Mycena chlorophos]|uniref:Uncharacterized protein n=1 Tax=Mycena chlorophos TaxID=658473 RepID=A0A8H6S3M3_MYCCL|nr:hypothetical protein HMN09_01241900 [Mycena chlorophos]
MNGLPQPVPESVRAHWSTSQSGVALPSPAQFSAQSYPSAPPRADNASFSLENQQIRGQISASPGVLNSRPAQFYTADGKLVHSQGNPALSVKRQIVEMASRPFYPTPVKSSAQPLQRLSTPPMSSPTATANAPPFPFSGQIPTSLFAIPAQGDVRQPSGGSSYDNAVAVPDFRAERDQLKITNTHLSAENAALKQAMQGLNERALTADRLRSERDTARTTLQGQIEGRQKDRTQLMEQFTTMRSSLQAAERDKALATQQARMVVTELQEKNVRLQGALNQVAQEMQRVDAEREALRKERNELRERLQALEETKAVVKSEPEVPSLSLPTPEAAPISEAPIPPLNAELPPTPASQPDGPEMLPTGVEQWQSPKFYTLALPSAGERPRKRRRTEHGDGDEEAGDVEEEELSAGPPCPELAPIEFSVAARNNPARWFMAIRKIREEMEAEMEPEG